MAALPPSPPAYDLTIEAGRTEGQYWRDLWKYRELFLFLAWRDLLVRYKQTIVGVAWSIIRPFLTMLILAVVFGKLSKMSQDVAEPYALVVFAGMLPWQFFANAFADSGNSLVANSNLISKVYFPRLIIPACSVITSLVDFLISAGFLVILMVWYHFVPPAAVVYLPLFLLLTLVASFGVGLWVAALMVEYRDFRFIIQFVVQFGLYLSPVGFISSKVPPQFRLLYSANPMAGIIDGFRWCLLGGQHAIYGPGLAVSLAVIAVLVVSGVWYFRRMERTFADVI
jgi:lipopolysaccharide transport system permease protein